MGTICINLAYHISDTSVQVDSLVTHGLAIAQPGLWWSHFSQGGLRAVQLGRTEDDNVDGHEEDDEQVGYNTIKDIQSLMKTYKAEEPETSSSEAEEEEEDPMNIRPVRPRTTSTSSWYSLFSHSPQKVCLSLHQCYID
jgi:hypothetical protein